MKRIPISIDIWRKLRQIRDEQGFKHYNKTLQWLMQQASLPDRNTAGTNIELSDDLFDRLTELKHKNSLDSYSETIEAMIHQLEEYQREFDINED